MFVSMRWLTATDFLIIAVALLVGRRMRDFGWSPWLGVLGVALISLALPVATLIIWLPSGPLSAGTPVPPGVGWVPTVLLLALVAAVRSKSGDPGPNRYGEAPSDHYRLWPRRTKEVGPAAQRQAIGQPLALALDTYI